MEILLGMERSGIIRDAFRKKGHNAWSCDLVESERPGPHLVCDIFEAIEVRHWDMAIFHPECTFLTVSQAWTFSPRFTQRFPERHRQRADAIKFAERLFSSRIKKIALENPVGFLSTMSTLGKPSQIIQPWEYGHPESKGTCLWLKGLPELRPTDILTPERYRCSCCGLVYRSAEFHLCFSDARAIPVWDNQTPSGQNKLSPGAGRAMNRARTYEGIAAAMADQWG